MRLLRRSLCTEPKGKVIHRLLFSVCACRGACMCKKGNLSSRPDDLNVAWTREQTAFKTCLWVYTAAYLAGRGGPGKRREVSRPEASSFHSAPFSNRVPVATLVGLEFAIRSSISSRYRREHWELSDPWRPNKTNSISHWELEIRRLRHKALVSMSRGWGREGQCAAGRVFIKPHGPAKKLACSNQHTVI